MRLAALALTLLAACSPATPQEPVQASGDLEWAIDTANREYERMAREAGFLRVIDGDSFELQHETFRIANIDAPEMPPRHRCDREGMLALMATQELERLFEETRPVSLILQRDGQDRYGRTLARVSLDGGRTDIGETLISQGLAVQWEGRRHNWCDNP